MGKLNDGLLLEEMKYSRAQFIRAFKLCKNNEEKIVNEKIASALNSRNTKIRILAGIQTKIWMIGSEFVNLP